MIDTIYFDNWNTLVKAPGLMKRGSSTRIFKEYLGGQGFEVPDNFIDIYVLIAQAQNMKAEKDGHREPDYRQRLEDVFTELGLPDPVEHSKGAWGHYLRKWPEQTEYFNGVPEMLADLKESYKLGIITNYMDGPTCRVVFEKLGYDAIFDSLVVSEELGYVKPAQILFETALKETGSLPENSVMVGDTFGADVVGGNLAGMKTVLVDIYDNQHENYHEATAVISDIIEFPGALRSL
ncbi:HAD family hydrolase [Candidatus Bathyarchaeota archaeon]|nr:HAD family hydrolase [Candidatus Bathyarchaeota archaeon]